MEKVGLMDTAISRLFRVPRMFLLFFSLVALVCLPIALSSLVHDASIGLLLPLTLLGALLAWGLAQWKVRGLSSGIILLFLGPLVLFIRMGQMGKAIVDLVRQAYHFMVALINLLFQQAAVDPSGFVSASHTLTEKFLALGSRIFAWTAGLWQGAYVEDPLIRTFAWSLAAWVIAVWAGWQISRNKRLLVGMIPTTILIALVVDYTNRETWIFWVHVSLLVFLYGLNGFVTLQKRWELSRLDYSESTQLETLVTVGVLTFALVTVSAFASKVSIKNILDDFREKRTSSAEARTEALGLHPAGGGNVTTGMSSGIPSSHLIGPGPVLSEELVMTVSTGDLPPMPSMARPVVPNYYWRTMTYEHYTGTGWTNPPPILENIPSEKILVEPPYQNYRLVHQEVTFANDSDEKMYWTGTLISAEVPFQALWIRKTNENPLLESDMLAAVAPAKTYRADSLLPDFSTEDLRSSPAVYPDWVRHRFLILPDSVPERVWSVARDLSASGKTPFDRALAIQNYLRQFPYSLDVLGPPPRRDVADYFLFDLKKGYCDYYATTMVVLARAAGLPSRIVMGYTSGSYDSEQARYVVTEKDAHAWVEIYLTNIGWVEFEPTPSQPAPAFSDISDAQVTAQPLAPQTSIASRFMLLVNRVFDFAWIPAIVLFLAPFVWLGWDTLSLSRLEPSRSIQLLYRRLRRIARPVSGTLSRGQTAHEYASLLKTRISSFRLSSQLQEWLFVARDEITQLTELYTRSIFSPESPSRAEIHRAIRMWSRLRWRLLCADAIAIQDRWLRLFLKQKD